MDFPERRVAGNAFVKRCNIQCVLPPMQSARPQWMSTDEFTDDMQFAVGDACKGSCNTAVLTPDKNPARPWTLRNECRSL
jgi:hypothetical protein